MDQVYRPLGGDEVYAIQSIAIQVAVDLVLYGVQLTLSIAAITILARRHGRSRLTLVAIFVLLSSSSIYTVAAKVYYLVQFPVRIGTSSRAIEVLLYRLDVLLSVTRIVDFVLSDVVLIWRAWCLWPDRRVVKHILLLCICGSVAGAIAELAWMNWPSLYDPDSLESEGQFLVRFVPLLVTNIVATVLIGTKVLHYRREVKGSLGLFTQRTQAETILLLLLESGLAYIVFWVADCTMAFVAYKDGFSTGAIFGTISQHIAGIYPTCVLFAAARGTTDSLLSAQVSQAMRFAGSPAALEGAREADMTIDFHFEDPVGALDGGPQDSDNLPDPSGTRSGMSRRTSSEAIIEVDRESTAA